MPAGAPEGMQKIHIIRGHIAYLLYAIFFFKKWENWKQYYIKSYSIFFKESLFDWLEGYNDIGLYRMSFL